jgi:hypothetical protein
MTMARPRGNDKRKKEMKRLIIIFIIFLSAFQSAGADYLKGEFIACMTEEIYDEMIAAASRKDEKSFRYLLQNGCWLTEYGTEIVILDTTWTGKVKARTYINSRPVEFWTNINNIERGK